MTPQMETVDPFTVLGVAISITRGSESPELFAGVWRMFESRLEEIRRLATGKVCYGVSFSTPDANATEYLAGMEVPAGTPSPDGLEARLIPGGEYAVFECPVTAIGGTYQHVFGTWLPGATVQFDSARPAFEQYPEDVAEKPVRIHIPVRQKPDEERGEG
jgi:predicted transcriptional regulator YdeE